MIQEQKKKKARCNATHHDTKEILLRDLPLRVLVDLHEPLRVRPDGDDHPSRTRELLHERGRYRPRRRANVNRVVRALRSVPFFFFFNIRRHLSERENER